MSLRRPSLHPSRLLHGSSHTVIARLSALTLAAILVVSVGAYAVLHYGVLDSGPEYTADFADAWPLVPGMDVRVSGAVAGSVRKVTLTDHGTAEVTFQLDPGVPQPRADASVAIRQSDLLGDTDLSLSLGSSRRALTRPIPIAHSIQEPRLDDFLDIFQKPVRVALQTFIVELGTAMENRGVDVNAAILKLRPGFEALGEVLSELRSQNDALAQVLSNSHQVTSQLASRTGDLDRLVTGLQRTVTGIAEHAPALDQDLAQLPQALTETGATLKQVRTLTHALAPLSRSIIAGAPGFQRAAGLVGPYARALSEAAKLAAPTVTLAGQALRHSTPALTALQKTAVASLLNPTSGLFSALSPILSKLSDGLFGSATAGGGLGGVVLPGNDALAPHVDPLRDYLSGYLVISCELFGVPDGPGCLAKILATYASAGLPTTPHLASAPPAGDRTAGATATSSPTAPPDPTTEHEMKPLLRYLIGQ